MHTRSIYLAIAALGLSSGLAVLKADTTAAPAAPAGSIAIAPVPVTAAAPEYTNDQLMEALGWFLGHQTQVSSLEFTQAQRDIMIKGFAEAVAGQKDPFPQDTIAPSLNAFMQKQIAQATAHQKAANKSAGEDYFAQLKSKPEVHFLPSGLAYEILSPGTGGTPKGLDTVRVMYTGKLLDGTVFDSNIGRKPAEFRLDRVIAGWTQGLQQIQEHGKIRLHVPSALAYGEGGRPGIPPNATLVFDVELLSIVVNPIAANSTLEPRVTEAPKSTETERPAPSDPKP